MGFHHETGEPVENPSDLNYHTKEWCDSCGRYGSGIMLHAEGTTGRVCPVLFLCFDGCYQRDESADQDASHDPLPYESDDLCADAEALASAGWGTDEDYGGEG